MPELDRDHERILGVLASRGIVSSNELQDATGKSQATVSRLLKGLSERVLTLGKARAARYALPKSIHGKPARQPILWTDGEGRVQEIGVLSFLADDSIHIDSDAIPSPRQPRGLPWSLSPLRVQGFLGRLHAQRLGIAGLDADPERWDLESVLYSALFLHDPSGAVTLGSDSANRSAPHRIPDSGRALKAALDAAALDVHSTLPAGSSAGGEQPKFLAVLENGQHVLVKFSPPRGTPFGDRWHDLLHAECIAGQVLARHGFPTARSRVVESASRTYLLSERFDRIGAFGRRHVVAIGEVHKAFVADAYANWSTTAEALARAGRLARAEAQQASLLLAFGRLIGNSDMHSGNLALFVELDDIAKGRFTLAPVYDMLPMRWRPDASLGGVHDYAPFEPDRLSLTGPAAAIAHECWTAVAGHGRIGAGLREVAVEMARRMALRP